MSWRVTPAATAFMNIGGARGARPKKKPAASTPAASMGSDPNEAVKKRLAAQLQPAATILGNTLG